MIRRLISLLLILWLLGFAGFALLLPQPLGAQKTDAVVVVTGGPGRIDRGLSLLEQGQAQRMLISGVGRTVKAQDLAARYPGSEKWFECCIALGFEAVDTRSNALEVARWMERRNYKSLRLVTSDWHMNRAAFEIERALPGNIVFYTDAVRTQPSLWQLWMEYHKYLLRRLGALVGA